MKRIQSEPLAFSKHEFCEMLGISLATANRMIQQGRLHAVKVSKRRVVIPKNELERLLRGESEVRRT